RSVLGWSLFALDYLDQGLKSCNEALAIAQSGASRHSEAFAQTYLADLHSFRREPRATQESAEQLVALSSEQGFPLWQAIGTTLRGWAMGQQGRYEDGIALIYEGSAAVRTMGIRARGLADLFLLADACIEAGRFGEAADALTKARGLA